MRLRGFNRRTSAAFLERALGAAPSDDLVDAAHATTGGNALFLAEYARADASGSTVESGDVATLVADRFTRLSDPARLVASWAAILGADAATDLICDLGVLSPDEVSEAVDELTRREVLSLDGGSELVFAHGLIEEAIYDQIPLAERRRCHRQVAEHLLSLIHI